MRKAQKKEADELIELLGEAHSQIRQYMRQNDARSAKTVLEDCQNSALVLGTLIESTEGEGHPTVSLLEEYCELLYQIYRGMEDGKGLTGEGADGGCQYRS